MKNTSEAFECGAIACYVGFVRGIGKNGSKVQKLVYEAWEDEAVKSLKEIRLEILKENGDIKDLLIYHVIDEVKPKDETVFIVALGMHRYEVISAIKKAIDEIKKRPPIWKKEYTEKGAYWI